VITHAANRDTIHSRSPTNNNYQYQPFAYSSIHLALSTSPKLYILQRFKSLASAQEAPSTEDCYRLRRALAWWCWSIQSHVAQELLHFCDCVDHVGYCGTSLLRTRALLVSVTPRSSFFISRVLASGLLPCSQRVPCRRVRGLEPVREYQQSVLEERVVETDSDGGF
jgi:hypothetical protein